ncbi:MAG: hypothetical protein H8E60_06980 [Candidatus Marinimicrobia bacterium]|nr:hypothetical protein [Candidatus Neomarinimicrobiota bacterium]
MEQLKKIEKLEKKYLEKYYHFLKFAEDELLYGFKTKQDIEDDWIGLYKSGISDFAVGAERIVYSLLNGKGIGQPNSCPVGADLFFEVQDAYIHLDLKTVSASLTGKTNIGDYTKNIFVGTNQNSYKGRMIVNKGNANEEDRDYTPSLPTFYNKGTDKEKICLTYFVTILYDKDNLDILVMGIVCMPNGELEPHYTTMVLQAGKNLDKTRFRFTDVPEFELLEGEQKRIKIVYFDKNMNEDYRKKVTFFEDLFDKQ